jgi:predicted RNA-binding protein YlxR (DUF448 family)
MARGGAAKERDGPERRCIATGERSPPSGLIRFALGPGGQVVPDVLGRLPGRGMWVAADRAALERAARRGLFARAARAPVSVPPDLVEQVEAALVQRLVGLIALERKAGRAVAGFGRVKDWLEAGTAAVLIQAADGSPRERAKLRPPGGPGTRVTALTAAEIGLAFGRERAIHAALAAGGLATRVVEDAARLSGVRGAGGAGGAPRERTD